MFKIQSMNIDRYKFFLEELMMSIIKRTLFSFSCVFFVVLLAACADSASGSSTTTTIETDRSPDFAFSSSGNAFSVVIDNAGVVYWDLQIDSCDDLIEEHGLVEANVLKVNILPANGKDEPYLYPNLAWKLVTENDDVPGWFTEGYEQKVWSAFDAWKSQAYDFNYVAVRSAFDATTITPHTPTAADIDTF
jgi:hypothetical protein